MVSVTGTHDEANTKYKMPFTSWNTNYKIHIHNIRNPCTNSIRLGSLCGLVGPNMMSKTASPSHFNKCKFFLSQNSFIFRVQTGNVANTIWQFHSYTLHYLGCTDNTGVATKITQIQIWTKIHRRGFDSGMARTEIYWNRRPNTNTNRNMNAALRAGVGYL